MTPPGVGSALSDYLDLDRFPSARCEGDVVPLWDASALKPERDALPLHSILLPASVTTQRLGVKSTVCNPGKS